MAFDYRDAPVPIPSKLLDTHERAWARLARAGNWWTGAERVQIAAETRNALDCALCRDRKAAVSPFSIDGEHTHTASALRANAIDAVHRITTDAGRLSQSWLEKNATDGLSDGHYVELVGVVVAVISIDEFHRGLGIPLAPLPDAQPGEPSRERPAGLKSGVAWVPMLDVGATKNSPQADLFAGMPKAPNVIAAMSLVPDAVRQLKELSAVHYLPMHQVGNPRLGGEALSRVQIELIAGRVSALNECFY